jgi:4-hydroxybenzoate polyprenyltransferase
MKRLIDWPQAYLGLTINWGAIMGYTAAAGSADWSVVAPLYFGAALWTLFYDTIYAHQDMRDDVKAGVKSTALLFAGNTRPILSGFAGLAGAGLAASGVAAGCGAPFFASAAAAGGHLLWQVWTVDLDSRADCSAKFASNKWYGALVYAGIIADNVMAGAPLLS